MRKGHPFIDTGRDIWCPGPIGGAPCRLTLTARPGGASARLRGRPRIAGTAHVVVAAGRHAQVTVPLNRAAYRFVRAHRKLTLSVVGVVTRSPGAPKRETFVFTVRPPARAKR
jgi:hypothetical protein